MPNPTVPPSRSAVLYVEDHPVNAMLMSALFERRPGLCLHVAPTASAALRMADGLHPALLLLDLNLPDGHGAALLLQLRRIAGCRDIPAVAVTADARFDIRGTGFQELWAKPLDLKQVLERVDALVAAAPRANAATSSRRAMAPLPRLLRAAAG